MTKSPFMVFPGFVSPKICTQMVDDCAFLLPARDPQGQVVTTSRYSELAEQEIYTRVRGIMPTIESHYKLQYNGMTRVSYEWLSFGCHNPVQCSNSANIRGKWTRINSNDLTAVLFLSDFNNQANFDTEFEVYGGKLSFPQWQFGFLPVRGTLIVFPSDMHFMHQTERVLAGNLYQARFHISSTVPYTVHLSNFPGNPNTWFNEL